MRARSYTAAVLITAKGLGNSRKDAVASIYYTDHEVIIGYHYTY